MSVKDFLELLDDWSTKVVVNDDGLNKCCEIEIEDLMVNTKDYPVERKLLRNKVVSWGMYDDILYIRTNKKPLKSTIKGV